jgi:hypothetical protein
MVPWVFFLFIGVFDFGFYGYAAIATANAARVAALNSSSTNLTTGDQITACAYAKEEMSRMPNAYTFMSGDCTTGTLIVRTALCAGGGAGVCSGILCPAGEANCVVAQVRYNTPQLVPIPGILTGQLEITRTAVMRVRDKS